MSYLFEDYSLDAGRRELRRGAEFVAVEPLVFDLLEFLIRSRDRVVSKDDLIASVWHGRIVSESTLTSRMNAARHAVGDNGEQQRLIRTIPRKGFRFVGDVQEQIPREKRPEGQGQTSRTRRSRARARTDAPAIWARGSPLNGSMVCFPSIATYSASR